MPGEVISINDGASLREEEKGMGVRFHGLDEAQRKAIDDLCETVLQRAAKR